MTHKEQIAERDRVVAKGDPEEAAQYIVATGGAKPPSHTNWEAVFEAARASVRSSSEFDESYCYDWLGKRDMKVAGDLIFPRNILLAESERLGLKGAPR